MESAPFGKSGHQKKPRVRVAIAWCPNIPISHLIRPRLDIAVVLIAIVLEAYFVILTAVSF